jgi:hypothetical protein
MGISIQILVQLRRFFFLDILIAMKKSFGLIAAAFIFLLSSSVLAEDCSSMNVLDKYKDGSKASRKMLDFFSKPRNQNSWGACYGFTAADMLSFELNVPISALHVTAKYELKKEQERELHAGGDPAQAMDLASPEICSEEDFPNFVNVSKYRNHEIPNMLETLDKLKLLSKNISHRDLCQTVQNSLQLHLPNLAFDDIANILAASHSQSSIETLNQFAEKNCRQKVKVPKYELEKSNAGSFYEDRNGEKVQVFGGDEERVKALQVLDEGLSKGKLVGIGYRPIKMLNLEADDPNIGHASTVTGRKLVNGKCMYTVRNSWGNSPCGNRQVPSGIICGTKEGQDVPFGSYLVSRETLAQYLDDSFYVK